MLNIRCTRHWSLRKHQKWAFLILYERFQLSSHQYISLIRKSDLTIGDCVQKFPRISCSTWIASNRALKLPAPKPWWFLRWITSTKNVGRSCSGLVKIWRRYLQTNKLIKKFWNDMEHRFKSHPKKKPPPKSVPIIVKVDQDWQTLQFSKVFSYTDLEYIYLHDEKHHYNSMKYIYI